MINLKVYVFKLPTCGKVIFYSNISFAPSKKCKHVQVLTSFQWRMYRAPHKPQQNYSCYIPVFLNSCKFFVHESGIINMYFILSFIKVVLFSLGVITARKRKLSDIVRLYDVVCECDSNETRFIIWIDEPILIVKVKCVE